MELVKLIKLQWDRSLALALAVIGGVMLIVGWFRVSDSPVVTEQVPYVVSAGLGGMFLLGVGATLWLSADFRDEWRALEDLSKREVPGSGDGHDPTAYSPAGPDAAALVERVHELEARLAAVETKASSSRGRSRKLRAPQRGDVTGAVAPTLAD